MSLDVMARYGGQLLAPAEHFNRGYFGGKRPSMLFWPNLGHFWCSLVILVTFSNNLSKKEEEEHITQSVKTINLRKKSKSLKRSN